MACRLIWCSDCSLPRLQALHICTRWLRSKPAHARRSNAPCIGRGAGGRSALCAAVKLDRKGRGVITRLPAHLEVAGLIRAVQAAGGFATVLNKGEREAGTILIVLTEKAQMPGCLNGFLMPRAGVSGPQLKRKMLKIHLNSANTLIAAGCAIQICGLSNWISRMVNGSSDSATKRVDFAAPHNQRRCTL